MRQAPGWSGPAHDMELQGTRGEPIWVSTRSSHCRGPLRCSSTQHGVEVTVWRRYSAPQPLTKLIRMVHMRVSWYTASKPRDTDVVSRAANSWLLKIFRLQPGEGRKDGGGSNTLGYRTGVFALSAESSWGDKVQIKKSFLLRSQTQGFTP